MRLATDGSRWVGEDVDVEVGVSRVAESRHEQLLPTADGVAAPEHLGDSN
jgi:hypothetical protein